MKRLTTYLISIAAITFILPIFGCGQSGPLYIPGDPSTISVPVSTDPGDEASENSSDEEDENDPPSPQ